MIHDIWYGDVLAARVDTEANTLTQFDEQRNPISVRELTEAERIAADPPPMPPPIDERMMTAEAALTDHRARLDAFLQRLDDAEMTLSDLMARFAEHRRLPPGRAHGRNQPGDPDDDD